MKRRKKVKDGRIKYGREEERRRGGLWKKRRKVTVQKRLRQERMVNRIKR